MHTCVICLHTGTVCMFKEASMVVCLISGACWAPFPWGSLHNVVTAPSGCTEGFWLTVRITGVCIVRAVPPSPRSSSLPILHLCTLCVCVCVCPSPSPTAWPGAGSRMAAAGAGGPPLAAGAAEKEASQQSSLAAYSPASPACLRRRPLPRTQLIMV